MALFLDFRAHAGAAPVELSCASDSGRTQLAGSVPGDMAEHDLKFSIDDKAVRYDGKGSRIEVSDALKKQHHYSFTVKALNEETVLLSFRAIPETVVVIPDRGTGLHINFRAQIQGADPRDLTSKSKRIELFCTYDYRL